METVSNAVQSESWLRTAGRKILGFVQIVGTMLGIAILGLVLFLWEGVKWLGRVVRKVHLKTGDMKRTLIAIGVICSAAFAYIYLFVVEVSALAAGPLLAWIGIVLFYVVVKFGHSEIDLIEELKSGNTSVAYHFRSYALLIAVLLAAPVLALAL